MAEKPDCKDFIVAAIRIIRPKIRNPKHGTSTGAPIYRIFDAALEFFDKEEFRIALDALLYQDVVMVTARCRQRAKDGDTVEIAEFCGSIPEKTNLESSSWVISEDGEDISHLTVWTGIAYTRYRNPRLFVVSDGLPTTRDVKRRALLDAVITAANELAAERKK